MGNPGMMQGQGIQGNPVLMQGQVQQSNQILIQGTNTVQSMNQLNEPAKDLRNLLNPNQPTVIGLPSQQPQKMNIQQQGNPNWINNPQQQPQQMQQAHIQQQPNQQIYMTNTPVNIVQQQQQQQKQNQNFQQFYDTNQYQ
jgi:hypothetical protein